MDGTADDIAYILVDEGSGVLTDCDTQENWLTSSFYLPESDADGDGVPDDGAEPFLVVPDQIVTGRKFAP